MIEEKLSKIDDMSRSIDRTYHDVENLNVAGYPRPPMGPGGPLLVR